MNFIQNIYDHSMVMYVKFCQDILWLSKCQLIFLFSAINFKLASNRRNFMKLIRNIYDHSVMMHVKFHEDVILWREVIAL